MRTIKIYTESQVVLLRNINPLLGRFRIPKEIIKRIDYILSQEKLSVQGFVLLLLDPVKDDIRELEDAVNAYPLKIIFHEKADKEKVKGKMGRGRDWYVERLRIQETGCQIYVLYSTLRKNQDKDD